MEGFPSLPRQEEGGWEGGTFDDSVEELLTFCLFHYSPSQCPWRREEGRKRHVLLLPNWEGILWWGYELWRKDSVPGVTF